MKLFPPFPESSNRVQRAILVLLLGPRLALVTGALTLGEGLGWGLAVIGGHGGLTLVMRVRRGLVQVTKVRGCLTLVGPLLGVGEALEVRLGGRMTMGLRLGGSLALDARLGW